MWIAAWEEEGEVGYLGMILFTCLVICRWQRYCQVPTESSWIVSADTGLPGLGQAEQIQCSLGIWHLLAVLFHGVHAHISAQEIVLNPGSLDTVYHLVQIGVISPGFVCSLLYLALHLSLKHPQFQPLGKPGENRSPWLCLKTESVCCSHSWWKHPFFLFF